LQKSNYKNIQGFHLFLHRSYRIDNED